LQCEQFEGFNPKRGKPKKAKGKKMKFDEEPTVWE